jgi:hypothetical protein
MTVYRVFSVGNISDMTIYIVWCKTISGMTVYIVFGVGNMWYDCI